MTSPSFPVHDAAIEAAIVEGLGRVETDLHAAVRQADGLVDAASRHLVEAGGKRLRPALTLLTAQLGEGVTDAVLKAAVAVELTHLASLYHDDVMDEAAMRRGAPSETSVIG